MNKDLHIMSSHILRLKKHDKKDLKFMNQVIFLNVLCFKICKNTL